MVVRMKETRMYVGDIKYPSVLVSGKEYDLPKEFAAFLILEKKATYIPGRLRKFAPKECLVPKEKKSLVSFSKFLQHHLVKLDE